jgi:hypothetical protein
MRSPSGGRHPGLNNAAWSSAGRLRCHLRHSANKRPFAIDLLRAYLPGMEMIQQILELAWEHAYPGREAAERNAILRELTPPMPREQLAAHHPHFRPAPKTGRPCGGRRIGAGGHAGRRSGAYGL